MQATQTPGQASPNWTTPFRDRRAALDERHRLLFAKQILAWLAVICCGIIAGYAAAPDNKALAAAFEIVRVGALPILTLVLSFYFPSNSIKS